MLTDDAWALQEAVDPPADALISSVEQPPLKRYAEYVQSSASASRMGARFLGSSDQMTALDVVAGMASPTRR